MKYAKVIIALFASANAVSVEEFRINVNDVSSVTAD